METVETEAPARVQPLTGPRLGALLLAVAAGLALLGLASRGLPHHRNGRAVQPVSGPHAFDYLLAFAVTAWIVALIVSTVELILGRRRRRRRRRSTVGERPLWSVDLSRAWRYGLIAIVIAILVAPLVAAWFLRPGGRSFQRLPTPLGSLIHGFGPRSLHTVGATLEWTVPVALALLAGVGAWLYLTSRRARPRVRRRTLVEELTEALDESLDDIEADGDARHAVVRAYARMERVLGGHGLPRRRSETPYEYLDRVLEQVHASGPATRRLTELYERARFSTHAIDTGMKEQALDAVRSLRGELEAAAA
jgi:hypothetical protein